MAICHGHMDRTTMAHPPIPIPWQKLVFTLTSQINDRGRLLIFEEKGPEVGLIEERSFIVFAENFP